MYLSILKKDLKRKKTMNIILLIFVTLAATFIASSANNLITSNSALDNFMEKTNAPDYCFTTLYESDIERFREFADENGYDYYLSRFVQINPNGVSVEGETLDFSNTLALAGLDIMKVFDKNNDEITHINDGEIYVTCALYDVSENDFHEGAKIIVNHNGVQKEFTVAGYAKDSVYGSAMSGMSKFILSDNDLKAFESESTQFISAQIYTNDPDYADKFNSLGLNCVMSLDKSMIKMMYVMDMVIAAVLLVVSVCLILISMVILRFIINFTVIEEFREIGVMKAIGINNRTIRGLYIVKYTAIAVVGTAVGMALSIPFGSLLNSGISKKIVVSGEDNLLINIAAALLAGVAVVLFSYFCTHRICKFSPIDAIRSGETGERFKQKSILRLGRSRIPTLLFMALNDILSGPKSYVSMIIIFILGTLLLIIPVNTGNTLRSDNLALLFNMAKSDHVISKEMMFSTDGENIEKIEAQFDMIKEKFGESGIEADVFQEIIFRNNVRRGDKFTNSLSFHGRGDVTTDMYAYIEGTAPQNPNEVALTYITAEQIGVEIGDEVEIKVGESFKKYIVTAINQSMNNMGEGVRFAKNAELDYNYAAGSFGIQVKYSDSPDDVALGERKAVLEKLFPDAKVYTAGEYINFMIGDIAGQLDGINALILSVVLGINALVAVLMVKSFITKERNEIALMKALGFKNRALTEWQTMRIGVVLVISVLVGAAVSGPLSEVIITPIFRMMGAFSIEFEIRGIEVYLVYPMIVLTVTALAAFGSAQGVRKIETFEIANNE